MESPNFAYFYFDQSLLATLKEAAMYCLHVNTIYFTKQSEVSVKLFQQM